MNVRKGSLKVFFFDPSLAAWQSKELPSGGASKFRENSIVAVENPLFFHRARRPL